MQRLPARYLFVLYILLCFGATPLQGKSYEKYSIPPDHKVKKWLDKTFKNRGYPETKKGFMKMGFRNFTRADSEGALVFKHRGCRGYLFKLYTNRDGTINEARVLGNRIKGADIIREYIVEKGCQGYFKVPKKWLYYHVPSSHTILVAEDMNILNREENLKKWKSKKVTEPLLTALVNTLKDLGLIDSIYTDNIPFCKDGKIAFIDTEHYQSKQPVRFDMMTHCLPKKLLPFWQSLIRD